MSSHREGIDKFNREQASRNNDHAKGIRMGQGGGHGKDTNTVAGSMKVNDPGPKGKSPSMGGSSDVKALGRASAGKIETSRKLRGA